MHIMLDLETLGTQPGCAILSIGAVAFSPEAGAIASTEPFYVEISLESTLPRFGVEAGTLRWWLEQGAATRRSCSDAPDRGDRPMNPTREQLAYALPLLPDPTASHLFARVAVPSRDVLGDIQFLRFRQTVVDDQKTWELVGEDEG